MKTSAFPISPLSLDGLTRDTWGQFDAAIIAQLAPLAENSCYQPKIYRAPSQSDEVLANGAYASYGLKITPGAIICAYYLGPASDATNIPVGFNAQITDQSLKHDWFDQPVPSVFLANDRPTYIGVSQGIVGSAPCFLDAPYPVVGTGLFLVQLWNNSGAQQRIELVFGVLEPIGEACL
jgi:hypothetical protein